MKISSSVGKIITKAYDFSRSSDSKKIKTAIAELSDKVLKSQQLTANSQQPKNCHQ
jgi:hypothetical protein